MNLFCIKCKTKFTFDNVIRLWFNHLNCACVCVFFFINFTERIQIRQEKKKTCNDRIKSISIVWYSFCSIWFEQFKQVYCSWTDWIIIDAIRLHWIQWKCHSFIHTDVWLFNEKSFHWIRFGPWISKQEPRENLAQFYEFFGYRG